MVTKKRIKGKVKKVVKTKPKQVKDPYNVLKYPISTEKAIRLMEAENKMVFRVERKTNRQEIKAAVEKMFNVKIVKVNTYFTPKGEKRAYVKFKQDTPAIDIATQLGLM